MRGWIKLGWPSKLETTRPFTEAEAWGLFRIAALGEAFGWSLLITGLAIRRYSLLGHDIAVPIAGQVHGMLFLLYFGIIIAVYSSLRWPRKKFLIAAVAGVVPFGTLVFEQWAARKRQKKSRQTYFCNLALASITSSRPDIFQN